jgi:O-antigen ligase
MERQEYGILALLGSVMVVSGLVFADIAPHVADYIVLIAGAVGLVAALVRRDAILAARQWWMLLLALVSLALTLPFVYRGSTDLVPILALAPFVVVPGVAFLLAQNQALLRPFALPLLCLFGAVAAALLGLHEYIATGGARVEVGNNPIHYGGIAVLLGFMALTGICVGRSPWRLVFFVGPIAGMAAAILSGSRGPLLGGMAMAVASMPMLIFWYRRDWALLLAIVIMVLGVPALALTFGSSLRAMSAFGELTQVAQNALTGQTATVEVASAAPPDAIRVAMYKSALQQFLDSPIFGQGFGQILDLARAASPGFPEMATLEHLHSDLADFAALGGVLGLLAYGLIIAAPLANLRFGKAKPTDRVVALGSALLATGYLFLGMTNAMFGVLPQTVLFVLLLGYLIALRQSTDNLSTPLR